MEPSYYYYSFILNGRERIYYSHVIHETPDEILDWAVRYSFIKEKDKSACSNVRMLKESEVLERNKALYQGWWEKHKNDESLSGKIPPTIGEIMLGH